MTTITALHVLDVRAPTSRTLAGSDAVHTDPDYSVAYVVLATDDAVLRGHGFTFTLGPDWAGELMLALEVMLIASIYIASLFFPAPTRSLKGLTIYEDV